MVYDRWMMKQSSGKCTSSSQALVQAKDLEAKFLASLSAKGVLDISVQNLCSNIRDLYESIILEDHAFAEARNVEHSLWQLHYRQIENFRHLISSDEEWSIARDGSASTAFSKEEWRDLLQSKPALAAFRSFLVEASGFYHELILKLMASCGLALDLWDAMHYHEGEAVKFKRCQQSCYRCLVNLGDYARYKEFYVGNNPTSYDFSIAADFYRKAIAHWPVGGQPHNQLAVLAVYVEDELLAVYHYFRSLAVEKPFPTTQENLTILFDKNRVKYEELPQVPVRLTVPTLRPISRKTHEGVKSSRVSKPTRKIPAMKTMRELIGCFFVRLVRLNGLFFTKTSLEKFEEVFVGVLHDLQQLLALDDKNLELALGLGSCFGMACETHGAFGAIKLVVILICTLENVISGPRYTEAPMQNVLFQNVSTALLAIVGQLMQRCAGTQDASASPLLPAMLVFLEWLSCRPDIIQEVDKKDEQFKLLSVIWKQFIRLLNGLCDEEKAKSGKKESSVRDSKMGVALWEDFELQGFSPLSSAHAALLYGERPKGNSADISKDKQFRVHRLVAAGNALSTIAVGSSMGTVFRQGVAKINLLKEEKADQGIVGNKICRPVHVAVVTQIKDEVEPRHNKQACRDDIDDDDEEELIVFQPAAKEQLVMAASGCNTAASEPPSDTASVFRKAAFSCAPSVAVVSLSSVSDSIESSMAPNPERLPNPSSLYNAPTPRMETCHTDTLKSAAVSPHSTDLRDLTAVSTKMEKYEQSDTPKINKQANMPLFKQPSENHPMRPSMHYVNDSELSSLLGLRKTVNSLGVIGQPKQIHSCMPETVNDFKSRGLNSLHDDVIHYSAMPHTVNSFAQKQSPLPFRVNLSSDVQGRSHAGRASNLTESGSNLVESVPDLTSSVFNHQSLPHHTGATINHQSSSHHTGAAINPQSSSHQTGAAINHQSSSHLTGAAINHTGAAINHQSLSHHTGAAINHQSSSHHTSAAINPQSSSHHTGAAINHQSLSHRTGAAMCPPPGFGPRPMKSPMSSPVGNVSNQQAEREQWRLDNQCRPEDSKSSSFTENYAEKHNVPPGYSLWSNVNNKVLQPGGGTLPSRFSVPSLARPGERPGPAVHLQQPFQSINEEETWSLFGSTAGFNWTPTILS